MTTKLPSRVGTRGRLLVVSAIVALSLAFSATAGTADEDAARHAVQSTIDRVMVILGDAELTLEQKKDEVEAVAIDSFDFEVISRLVLARNLKKFDDGQRAAFTDVFKRHLSATYRDTLDSYSDESITVDSARTESNGDVTVKSAIHIGGDDVKVDYRLRKKGDRWLGIDVVIEGVSLVQNFRAQAQEIVGNEGPDALIEKLRAKVRGTT